MKTSVVVADGTFLTDTAPIVGDYESVAREAAEIGFDAIQLTVNRPSEVSADEVLRATRRYNLAVSSIATGRGNTVDGLALGSCDAENRANAVTRMCEHVALAERLGGARVIIGSIRGWKRDAGNPAEYPRLFTDSVAAILDCAEKHDIDVLLEANDHLETDAFLDAQETSDFIQSFHSAHFKLQLDTMHMANERATLTAAQWPRLAPVAQVDISGAARSTPSDETAEIATALRVLKEVDYRDYLVFEFRAVERGNAAEEGLAYVRRVLG